jgi:D-alanyl-D-alanine-carboxypeptidase/D-alanyl-D-alanine-endopeptidase
MRTLRCIAPLFVVVACGTKQSVPPPKASLHQSALDSWARPLVQDEWFAGISVSLIHDGEVEHFGYGHASDAGEPITAKTRFEMGSVSKVFTSVLLADQVLQSKLTLDTPVQDLLPAGNTVKGGTVPITLRHLVTHTSGLPRMPANFAPKNPADPFADYTPGLLYAYLASTPLEHAAGTRYDYSNTGAGLVGHVISLSTGQSYDQLVVNRVAMPLGMADTRGAHTPGLPVAQGHRADGSATPVWNWDALAGAGAVVSNGQDMARFVQAAMNPPQTPVGRALAMTLEAQPSAPQQRMAMGWHVGLGAGPADQTRWHNGQTHGFHTFVAVDGTRWPSPPRDGAHANGPFRTWFLRPEGVFVSGREGGSRKAELCFRKRNCASGIVVPEVARVVPEGGFQRPAMKQAPPALPGGPTAPPWWASPPRGRAVRRMWW